MRFRDAPGGVRLLPLLRAAEAHEQRFEWCEALRCYEAAACLAPTEHRILANQGNAAWLAGQPRAAHDAFRRAVLLAPECALSLRGLGNALRDLGRFEAAHRAYSRSRLLDPEPITAWNHSQVLIGLERYAEAYEAAEHRFDVGALEVHRQGPYWDGDTTALSLTQEPLRIWSEQGLGDTLQCLRWIPRLWSRLPAGCSPPVLEVEAALVGLVERGLSWLDPPPLVVAKSDSGSIADAAPQLSLLSLPHRLAGAPHPWLPPGEAYLLDPDWLPRRPLQRSGRVGLVWASGRKLDDRFQAREYRLRSLPPDALRILVEGLQHRGVEVVNLQVGPDREPPAELGLQFNGALPASMDFADTARFITDLDRVITVDTAMAHLVGALGRQDWVLLPYMADPRWHRNSDHTPWYPNLRLFRQHAPGDWLGAVRQVLAAMDCERVASGPEP